MIFRQNHLPFTLTLPLPFIERSRGLESGREVSAALALALPGERWHVGPAWPDTCPHHQPTDTRICLCTETHHDDFLFVTFKLSKAQTIIKHPEVQGSRLKRKLVKWPWCWCAWLASKLTRPEHPFRICGVLSRGKWETRDQKMQMSWRPLSKKPGLPYHLSSATNWSSPCHAELRQ